MAAVEEQDKFKHPGMARGNRAAGSRSPRRRSSESQLGDSRNLFWNVLTLITWLGIASVILAVVLIINNPAASINPFRPGEPTLVSVIALPTETASPTFTITPKKGPATRTVTPTRTATITLTPSPTYTETPTPGPSATPTIKSAYPFILRSDPVFLAGSTFPDHEECKLWVAGQTYDLQGAPMVGITVMMGGYLKGKDLYQLSLTGTALQYGQAGYEFVAADQPADSNDSVWIQLFDQALIPLSNRITLDTFEDCSQNLILVNFRQIR